MRIPWGHHRVLIDKFRGDVRQALFYLSKTVENNWSRSDRQIRNEWDGPTVGLVLCRSGERTAIEYALNTTSKPMGIGSYQLFKKPPKSQPELKDMATSLAKLGPVVDETIAEFEAKAGAGR